MRIQAGWIERRTTRVATAEATAAIRAGTTTNVSGGGAAFTIGPGSILYTPELVQGGGPQAAALVAAAVEGKPFCAVCAGMSAG